MSTCVIDSSALVAIVEQEADWEPLLKTLIAAKQRLISAASALETQIVLENKHRGSGGLMLDAFLNDRRIEVRAFDVAQLALAREAWLRFGKGRHPAALNFGDCFSYALARLLGLPLLFTGGDFAHTDLVPAR